MSIELQLQQLNLPAKETTALQFLLSSGETAPSHLAKQLKINRTTAYDILNSLSDKNLVTRLEKRGKLIYQVVPPKSWGHYWDKQERKIKEQKEFLQQLLPDLDSIYRKSKYQPRVTFYEGLDGLQQAVLDSLDVISDEIVGYSAVSQVIKFMPPKFVAYYTNEKIKREIKSRFVLKSSEENKNLIENYKQGFYKKDSIKKFTPQYRLCVGGKYEMKNEIMIYDNKVLICNIIPPHFSATLIQDENIAEGQKAIFEIAWENSDKIA